MVIFILYVVACFAAGMFVGDIFKDDEDIGWATLILVAVAILLGCVLNAAGAFV